MEKKFGLPTESYYDFDLNALREAFPNNIERVDIKYTQKFTRFATPFFVRKVENEYVFISEIVCGEICDGIQQWLGNGFEKEIEANTIYGMCVSYDEDFDMFRIDGVNKCNTTVENAKIKYNWEDLNVKFEREGTWRGVVITASMESLLKIFNARSNPYFTLAEVENEEVKKYFDLEIGSYDPRDY